MYLLNPIEYTYPKLHINVMDILFKHQSQISKKFSDIKGVFNIDHVAIIIVNPRNEMVLFSSAPSVEFNLIVQGLWKFDMSFNPGFHTEGKILFWEDAYQNTYKKEIKYTKETQHNFSLGFNLIRKIQGFNLIYSFATRQNKSNLYEFYENLTQELISLGDYGYKLLRDIYGYYSDNYDPPIVDSSNHPSKKERHLRLITGNYDS